ncbi:MAG: hypothetical protein WCR52_10970 [Bacteroidota bacterium]
MQHFAKILRSFVAANRTKLVLAILYDFLPAQMPHLHDQVLLLQAGLSQAERDFATGVATRAEVQQSVAKVNAGLLNVIGEIARFSGDEKQALAQAQQIESGFQDEEFIMNKDRRPVGFLWAIGLPTTVLIGLLGWYIINQQGQPEKEQQITAHIEPDNAAKDPQKAIAPSQPVTEKTSAPSQSVTEKTLAANNPPGNTGISPARSSEKMAFRHVATAANTSGQTTILDHPKLNGNPKAIIFVMPTYNANGATGAKRYTQNVAVQYKGDRWTIVNENGNVAIAPGTTFNVLIAPPNNPNCFTYTTTQASVAGIPNGTVIDHPATNGKSDAMLLITQNLGSVFNDVSQVTSYSNGKWYISNNGFQDYYDGKTKDTRYVMPVGARFNVMVIENNIVPGFPLATAFMHLVKTSNTIKTKPSHTFLERADLTNNPNAMLFATAYWGHGDSDRTKGYLQHGGPYNEGPLVAWYDHPDDKLHLKDKAWFLYNGNSVPLQEGTKINVVFFQ